MENSWGTELWDRLDEIISHCNLSSNIIDKCYKCFSECQSVWIKSANKQKKLLEKLQIEITEYNSEFTLNSSLNNIVNSFIFICNIINTFADSSAKTGKVYLKKNHINVKKESQNWVAEKKKMEDDLFKERKKYEIALKRYRDKQQLLVTANENYKRTDDNKTMSRSQVDLSLNTMYFRRTDYDQAKIEYASQLKDYNALQHSHFYNRIPKWTKMGEKLYKERLELIGRYSNEISDLMQSMVNKLNNTVKEFGNAKQTLLFEKDQKLLIQRYKTGDVPPHELKFIDLDLSMPEQVQVVQSTSNNTGNTKMQRNSTSSIFINTPRGAGSVSEEEDDGSISYTSTSSGSNSVIPPDATLKDGRQSSIKEQKIRPAQDSSISSFNLSSNHDTKSDLGIGAVSGSRWTVSAVKMRNTGSNPFNKILNPDARLSIHKSPNIFKSSQPWKSTDHDSTTIEPAQSKLYRKRPSRQVAHQSSHRRSRSVTDLISTFVRASLRKKPSPTTDNRHNLPSRNSIINTKCTSDSDDDDDDDDDDWEESEQQQPTTRPEIVSTPAEAIKLTGLRRLSASEMEFYNSQYSRSKLLNKSAVTLDYHYPNYGGDTDNLDSVDNPQMSVRPPSPDYENESLSISVGGKSLLGKSSTHNDDNDEIEDAYIGSCVAEYDFDKSNLSKDYLSFLAGDQFYILRMDTPNEGWLLVDRTDQSQRGFVPTSYFTIRNFQDEDNDNNNKVDDLTSDFIV